MSLEIKNLYKTFGDKVLFSDFSYKFSDKGIVLIKGASGCGKTTLLKMISGLEKADKGDIILKGTISFLFQEDRLLDFLNAEENIACVLKGKNKDKLKLARELIKKVMLQGNEKENIQNLSGGMKRRLAFARSIALSSDILLLDEPFNGLDPDSRKVISDIIKEYSLSHLVILISHNSADTQLADYIISL